MELEFKNPHFIFDQMISDPCWEGYQQNISENPNITWEIVTKNPELELWYFEL